MSLVGMDTSAMMNLFESLHVGLDLSLPASLIVIQASLRLGQIPIGYFLRNYCIDDHYYTHSKLSEYKRTLSTLQPEEQQHIKPSHLISQLLSLYPQVILFKSLSVMS